MFNVYAEDYLYINKALVDGKGFSADPFKFACTILFGAITSNTSRRNIGVDTAPFYTILTSILIHFYLLT